MDFKKYIKKNQVGYAPEKKNGLVFSKDHTFLGYFQGYTFGPKGIGVLVSTKPDGQGEVFIPHEADSYSGLYHHATNAPQMIQFGIHILNINKDGIYVPDIEAKVPLKPEKFGAEEKPWGVAGFLEKGSKSEPKGETKKPKRSNPKKMKNGGKLKDERELAIREPVIDYIADLQDKLRKANREAFKAKKQAAKTYGEREGWKRSWIFEKLRADSATASLKTSLDSIKDWMYKMMTIIPRIVESEVRAEKAHARAKMEKRISERMEERLKKKLPKEQRSIVLGELMDTFEEFKRLEKEAKRGRLERRTKE